MFQERIRVRNGPCLTTVAMHEKAHSHTEKMALRAMEKHFMASSEGRPFQAQYNQLEQQMMNIRKQYNDLWEKAEPAFVDYIKANGGDY